MLWGKKSLLWQNAIKEWVALLIDNELNCSVELFDCHAFTQEFDIVYRFVLAFVQTTSLLLGSLHQWFQDTMKLTQLNLFQILRAFTPTKLPQLQYCSPTKYNT